MNGKGGHKERGGGRRRDGGGMGEARSIVGGHTGGQPTGNSPAPSRPFHIGEQRKQSTVVTQPTLKSADIDGCHLSAHT